jgi:hypothetical protein
MPRPEGGSYDSRSTSTSTSTRALEYKILLCDRKINDKISIMSYITIGSIAERVSCFVFMLVLATPSSTCTFKIQERFPVSHIEYVP